MVDNKVFSLFRVVIRYTVMQLCSFKMRGVKRDEKKIIIYIYKKTIYFVRKAPKIGKRAKNNCIHRIKIDDNKEFSSLG